MLIHRVRRMVRKIGWEVVRGGPGRPARILTVPTENGILSFSNMDLHNGRGLYVQRAWEMDLIHQAMEILVREGLANRPSRDLMVDAGANIGMICIAMLRWGFFRSAVAVEPDPENFALLERNIEQNGMRGRIHAVACALTEAAMPLEIERSEVNYGDHRVRGVSQAPTRMGEERRSTVPVRGRTLDEVLSSEPGINPGRVGLLWVDVQGHDGYLFRGARQTLSGDVPVVGEVWPYGILRSGMDPETYADVVRSLFRRMVILDPVAGRAEPRPVDAVGELFRTHALPEQLVEVLFLP